jgi:CrcB protein
MQFLLVFLGGGLGSCLRYAARLVVESSRFPYATLAVNVIGSFAAGWIVHLALRQQIAPGWKLFLMTGVLGGFTTFSAFSGETIELLVAGRSRAAAINVLVSVVVCLLAAGAGFRIAASSGL